MRRASFLVVLVLAGSAVGASAEQERTLPYWVSLSAGDALMRSGPGREFPATWRYRRAGLPLQVIGRHMSWRRVREVDGTEGWVASVLLHEDRYGLVTGGIRDLHAAPDAAAKVVWRAEPGVIGKLSHCAAGWCEFDVKGRRGYVQKADIWGVDADETVD